jgi:hypothetical protein
MGNSIITGLYTEVPVFDDLYATWSEIFTPADDGTYIKPSYALVMARKAVESVKKSYKLPKSSNDHK